MMIDTHCHLDEIDYDDLNLVIKKMDNNIIIVSGVDDLSNLHVIDLCNKYNNVYGTLGFHPEYVMDFNDQSYKLIEENLTNPKIVGIGEIGLDYYWDKINHEQQKILFIRLINLAKTYNKTITVHSRDAINDTYNILKQEYNNNMRVVIHCYGSSLEMAQKFIELGIMLGIGGVVTFKNSSKLVEVVKSIDLKHLLLETDSPYLTPEPFRGAKNEPYNIIYVANKIAQIKDINVDKVLQTTTDNAIRQFDLKLKI